MTKYPAGRMLGGTGTLLGPSPNSQFDMVVEFLKTHLPQFAESVLSANIYNEDGLNSRLWRFITNAAAQEIFFAERESMEDETRGNSPAVDIGIYLKIEDTGIDPPLITVFEGKRLTTKLPNKRRREYVIGHEEGGKYIHCGGIERFKLSIHGGKLNHAEMIGYLQDGTPDSWRKKISAWICDLCSQSFDPAWSKREQLTPQKTDGRVTEYSSVVNRASSELHLKHLWIDLVL
jgi:hypothetical protein